MDVRAMTAARPIKLPEWMWNFGPRVGCSRGRRTDGPDGMRGALRALRDDLAGMVRELDAVLGEDEP